MQQLNGYLSINLSALRSNWAYLRQQQAGECGAVVKADAYGLGLEPVAQALFSEGCRSFFVATFQEAVEAAKVLPKAVDIYVLQGCAPGMEREFVERQFIPVLVTLPMAQRWIRVAGEDPAARCALKVNSGMNRLGLALEEFEQLLQRPQDLQKAGLSLLVSHLACADEPQKPLNQVQLQRFKDIYEHARSYLPTLRASLANSAGVMLGDGWQFDLARPGIGLYGGSPRVDGSVTMAVVVSLYLPVLQLHWVRAGEAIGYGGDYRVGSDMLVAVVAGGYGDGILRSMGEATHARGWFFDYLPMRGRVSMDSCVFDVTHLPECKRPKEGDFIELIGQHCSLDEQAGVAGTIAYELLTRLGGRLQKHYCEGAIQ